jgi:hypothetical protein
MTGVPGRVRGTPVRLRGGHLTHWAGREVRQARLLAHGDYAWADRITDPLPGGRECQRCKRRQPFFVKPGTP